VITKITEEHIDSAVRSIVPSKSCGNETRGNDDKASGFDCIVQHFADSFCSVGKNNQSGKTLKDRDE
jgi:hypothetical protein